MKTHWLAVAPILVSIAKRELKNIVALGSVLFTSVNYWRRPERGPRRNLDIVCVFTVGVYNIYRRPMFWGGINSVCFVFWRLANIYDSNRIHSLIHIIPACAYIFETLVIEDI